MGKVVPFREKWGRVDLQEQNFITVFLGGREGKIILDSVINSS